MIVVILAVLGLLVFLVLGNIFWRFENQNLIRGADAAGPPVLPKTLLPFGVAAVVSIGVIGSVLICLCVREAAISTREARHLSSEDIRHLRAGVDRLKREMEGLGNEMEGLQRAVRNLKELP